MGRYKPLWINQAMFGAGVQVPTNYGTVALYNTSSGGDYLVVRNWNIETGQTAHNGRIAMIQGAIAFTSHGFVQPVLPTNATYAGRIDQLDSASITLTTWIWTWSVNSFSVAWDLDLPFCVLPPNWSLVFQAANTGASVTVSFQYECVHADQIRSWPELAYEQGFETA